MYRQIYYQSGSATQICRSNTNSGKLLPTFTWNSILLIQSPSHRITTRWAPSSFSLLPRCLLAARCRCLLASSSVGASFFVVFLRHNEHAECHSRGACGVHNENLTRYVIFNQRGGGGFSSMRRRRYSSSRQRQRAAVDGAACFVCL